MIRIVKSRFHYVNKRLTHKDLIRSPLPLANRITHCIARHSKVLYIHSVVFDNLKWGGGGHLKYWVASEVVSVEQNNDEKNIDCSWEC